MFISYKECYLVEDEAQRPPSPRSLSMVINRYGLCLRLLQAAGRGAGALMGRKTTRCCTGGLKLEQLAGLSLNLPAP